MALTDSKLKSMLKGHDDPTPRKVADRGDGLGVIWRSSGKVSFSFRYRFASKPQNVVLGQYTGDEAGITLKDARRKTDQCHAWLDEGRNPAVMLKVGKDERLKPVTVKDAIEYWIDNYAREKRTNIEKHRQQFVKWVYPKIGDLPLADCDTRHWLGVFDAYRKEAPVAAGYCFLMAKQALKFCRVRRYAVSRALDDLTVRDVAKKQGKRDRYLSMEEAREVYQWATLPTTSRYYGPLTLILLSMGARTQEVRLSQLEEWDLPAGLWTVPIEHSKSDEKIYRPIPEGLKPMIEFLAGEAKRKGSSYLLGELKRPEAVSQLGRSLFKKFNHSEPWTLHDLRRTLATQLTEAEIAPHVIEFILGHSLPSTMGHYVHSQRIKEQRPALELWQTMLANTEQADNVLIFGRG